MSKDKIKCFYCQKNVYLNEGHNFHLGMVHTKCFNCQAQGCLTKLTLLNFTIANNKFLCKKHAIVEQNSTLQMPPRAPHIDAVNNNKDQQQTTTILKLDLKAQATISPKIQSAREESSKPISTSTFSPSKRNDLLGTTNKQMSKSSSSLPRYGSSGSQSKTNSQLMSPKTFSPAVQKEPFSLFRADVLKILPIIFKGDNSFLATSLCRTWYRAIWEHRASKESFSIRYSSQPLNAKSPLFDFFTNHFRNLSHLTMNNIYIDDFDMNQIFNKKIGINNLRSFSMKYLQNHSDVTHRGLQSMVEFSPQLSKFALTYLGGTKLFPSPFVNIKMLETITSLPNLIDLEVSVDISALPILAKLTSLNSLHLKFKSKDHTKNNNLTAEEETKDQLYAKQKELSHAPRAYKLPKRVETHCSTTEFSCLTMDKEGVWKFHPSLEVPVDEKEELNTSRGLFSLLSASLSNSLRHLTIEKTTSKWDLSGLCDGLDQLESLSLLYINDGTVLDKRWKGSSLRSLELRCVKDIGLDSFDHIQLKTLKITHRNSPKYQSFINWLNHYQPSNPNSVEELYLDGGVISYSNLDQLFQTCTFLKSLVGTNLSLVKDENNSSIGVNDLPRFINQLTKHKPSSLKSFQLNDVNALL